MIYFYICYLFFVRHVSQHFCDLSPTKKHYPPPPTMPPVYLTLQTVLTILTQLRDDADDQVISQTLVFGGAEAFPYIKNLYKIAALTTEVMYAVFSVMVALPFAGRTPTPTDWYVEERRAQLAAEKLLKMTERANALLLDASYGTLRTGTLFQTLRDIKRCCEGFVEYMPNTFKVVSKYHTKELMRKRRLPKCPPLPTLEETEIEHIREFTPTPVFEEFHPNTVVPTSEQPKPCVSPTQFVPTPVCRVPSPVQRVPSPAPFYNGPWIPVAHPVQQHVQHPVPVFHGPWQVVHPVQPAF